jgi:hypothetical protein
MIVLLREFLSGFAEHGAAGTVLSEEALRRVGILGQLARDAGPALAPLLDRRRSMALLRLCGPARIRDLFTGRPRLALNDTAKGHFRRHRHA